MFQKWRGIVSADGQDVAVAFVFVPVVIDIINHHREPTTLVVIAERTILHYCADSITILLSASPYFRVIAIEGKKRNKQKYISIWNAVWFEW